MPTVALVQAMRGDLAWQATTAGRSGRILVMPNVPFCCVDGPPSAQRPLGVGWLSALRPETLPAAALRADAAGLVALLFGIAVDDATIARLAMG